MYSCLLLQCEILRAQYLCAVIARDFREPRCLPNEQPLFDTAALTTGLKYLAGLLLVLAYAWLCDRSGDSFGDFGPKILLLLPLARACTLHCHPPRQESIGTNARHLMPIGARSQSRTHTGLSRRSKSFEGVVALGATGFVVLSYIASFQPQASLCPLRATESRSCSGECSPSSPCIDEQRRALAC